jgi:hypothetical protein
MALIAKPVTDERKRDLSRLCRHTRTRYLKQVASFPDGEALLSHCKSIRFRRCRLEAQDIGLRERPKPSLGQDQMPQLEARERGAAQAVRGTAQARELNSAGSQ